ANGTGRLTTANNGVSITSYGYDVNGNVEYLKQSVDNIDFIFAMEYDTQKRLTSLTYPDGTNITRTYMQPGYLKSVNNGTGAYVQYALDPNSITNVMRVTGDNVTTTITYNPANEKPVTVVSKDSQNNVLENSTYTYDNAGNILKIADGLKLNGTDMTQ